MTLWQVLAALVGLLGAGFGGWSLLIRTKARWVESGRQDERGRIAVAVVQRERELDEAEAENLREHMARVSEIEAEAAQLAEPDPGLVRRMLEKTRARARRGRGPGAGALAALVAAGAIGQAQAEVATITATSAAEAYRLTTPLERELWDAYVTEWSRAEQAESDNSRLAEDLEACREQPPRVLPAPLPAPSAAVWPWVAGGIGGALVLGVVLGFAAAR